MNRIIPCLWYNQAQQQIDWLCDTFGFDVKMNVQEDGVVMHAELLWKGNMIMIGSSRRGTDFDAVTIHPHSAGRRVTQAPYMICDDAELDSLYAKACANGAEIFIELRDEDYGGRNFSCRDPEGHIWSFGSYNPWADQSSS